MARALYDALKAKDVDRVAGLLAAGEDPNPPFDADYSYPPLLIVVGEVELVVLLLRYGADVNRWDEPPTTTALLTAAHLRDVECTRLLLAANANPNVKDEEGNSPLRLFTMAEDVAMVRLLLRCGADMYHSGGMDGMNSISLAATRLNVDLVRIFLAHGADPMITDNDGDTVFDRLRWFPSIAEPETPEKLERFHEIRRLLGGKWATDPSADLDDD